MENYKIALDCDGVLDNWYLHMCRHFNKPYLSIDSWYVPWLMDKYRKSKTNFNRK